MSSVRKPNDPESWGVTDHDANKGDGSGNEPRAFQRNRCKLNSRRTLPCPGERKVGCCIGPDR